MAACRVWAVVLNCGPLRFNSCRARGRRARRRRGSLRGSHAGSLPRLEVVRVACGSADAALRRANGLRRHRAVLLQHRRGSLAGRFLSRPAGEAVDSTQLAADGSRQSGLSAGTTPLQRVTSSWILPRSVEFSITLQSKRDVLTRETRATQKGRGRKSEQGLLHKLRRDDHEADPYPKSVSRVLEWETLLGREGGTQLESLAISAMDELKVCHLRLEGNYDCGDQDPGGRSTFDLPIRFSRSGERFLGRLRRSWRRFFDLDREDCVRPMSLCPAN